MLSESQMKEFVLECCLVILDAFPSIPPLPWVKTPEECDPPKYSIDGLEIENRVTVEAEQKRMQAATKADDAEVPMHL